jgi:uncharacterized protein (TIGR00369 family)
MKINYPSAVSSPAELQDMLNQSPMAKFMQLKVLELDCELGKLVISMPRKAEISRIGNEQFHGGALATLIDIAGNFAVAMRTGKSVPTVSLQIDYLRPAICDEVFARASIRRQGRTLATVDIDVTKNDGTIVALGRGSFVSNIN